MAGPHPNETLGQTLIPIINRIQDIFSQINPDVRLDLPQVAVVGSQSSGKSSVLEALVGRDFLPRGSNIVTRRPLILQLVKTPVAAAQHQQQSSSSGNTLSEWGEFLHLPGKRFHDFDRIRQEINGETDRLLGSNKGVSDRPIRLKIYSPNVLTMTLVDLPGLARVPVGDQPPDIEARLRSLILSYASSPSTIILAVSPANQDLASSDALDIAKQADPEGIRTIGVLTKLDIMDRGTDAVAALRNEVVPLKLGYVGVVLRSQEDIAQRRSMGEARESERAFFASRSEYTPVLAHCGVATLAKALNSILVEHIKEALPSLRGRLEEAAAGRRRELRMLGDAPPGSTGAARGAQLLSILDTYSSRFAAALDGSGDHLPLSELAGGARIRHIFFDIFSAGLDSLDPASELTDDDVRTAIKNSGGIKGTLLIPEAPFELLVRRAIERLLPPALQCKEFVYTELVKIATQCIPLEVARFPVLQGMMSEAVEELVNSGAGPAEAMIRNLVACELAFINTSHPQFVGGNRAIAEVLGKKSEGSGSASASGAGGEQGRSKGNIGGGGGVKAFPVHQSGIDASGGCARGAAAATTTTAAATTSKNNNNNTSNSERRNETGLAAAVMPSSAHNLKGGGGYWLRGWFHANGSTTTSGGALHDEGDEDDLIKSSLESPPALLQRPPPTLKVRKTASDQEGVQVEVTRVLVDSYFDIVRKNLQDAVPKAVMNFLVNATRRALQQHLIRTLYREELLEELMAEREDVAARRRHCQESLRALRAAIKTLDGLPSSTDLLLGSGGRSGSGKRVVQQPQLQQQPQQQPQQERSRSPLKSGLHRPPSSSSSGAGNGNRGIAHKAAMAAVNLLKA